MKNSILNCIAAIACLWFVSCSISEPSTASELAEIMCKAWVKEDAEIWMKYLNFPRSPSSNEEREKWLQDFKDVFSDNPLANYEILNEKLSDDGKKATVTVKLSYEDGDAKVKKMPFVKTDSGWKMEDMFW